jgi:hypothetical protein
MHRARVYGARLGQIASASFNEQKEAKNFYLPAALETSTHMINGREICR